MSKCNRYGKDVLLPFKCSFCERFFCFEHKLPENHDCPNQPARAPLGPLKTKTLPESAAYSMKSQNEVSTEKPKRRSISKAIVYPVSRCVLHCSYLLLPIPDDAFFKSY